DAISPRFQADKIAAEIAGHLRNARNRAVIEQKVVRLEIYPEERRILYFWEDPAAEWDEDLQETDETPFAEDQWDKNLLLERAIIGADEALDRQTVVLRFWPTGICTPVRLHLVHRKNPNLKRTVRLNPLTGLTRIVKGYETPEHYELKIKAPVRRN
ncbi:MAG: hypothetical protein GWP05_08845, partial [Anaerolineaceae bacterium]|nr:hypothetical protein [Anaerolineaceae bacterium]